MNVVDYCRQEIERRKHDTGKRDGIDRVGWMLNGWSYALGAVGGGRKYPMVHDLLAIGRLVEPQRNLYGWRGVNLRVAQKLMPNCRDVPSLLGKLFEERSKLTPVAFHRGLLDIYPFTDGNEPTAKIILGWLTDTLLDPPGGEL